MSIIVSHCQHCDEQNFKTLSCEHYTIFSVVKLDLFIRALLLDRILALEKLRVRLASILFYLETNLSLTCFNYYEQYYLEFRKLS